MWHLLSFYFCYFEVAVVVAVAEAAVGLSSYRVADLVEAVLAAVDLVVVALVAAVVALAVVALGAIGNQ
ncbi:hypothetical protein ENHYDAX1_20116 [Enhydrobacter sp. AX1]|nr:hypothetical protein ENHYDAX1_20116 [Enhydrobacter sp. AX1]